MQRIAARLTAGNVRAFRLDMRGCGDSFQISHGPTHSGRTGDVAAALARIASLAPESPIALVGFSLGGNVVLNLAAEIGDGSGEATGDARPPQLDKVLAGELDDVVDGLVQDERSRQLMDADA